MWAYAREGSAKEQMRSCYENLRESPDARSIFNHYADELHERFSAEKMYKQFVEAFYEDDEVTDDEIEALFASLE